MSSIDNVNVSAMSCLPFEINCVSFFERITDKVSRSGAESLERICSNEDKTVNGSTPVLSLTIRLDMET